MKATYRTLAIGIFMLIVSVSNAQTKDESCFELFNQLGTEKFDDGKYQQAIYLFEAALRCVDKKDEETVKLQMKKSTDCIKFMQKADDKINSGRYDAAKTFYAAIINLNPKDKFVMNQIKLCDDKISEAVNE